MSGNQDQDAQKKPDSPESQFLGQDGEVMSPNSGFSRESAHSYNNRDSGSCEDSLSDFCDHASDHLEHSPQEGAQLIPIEFAKNHIHQIEEDMKFMHERHAKLIREMDDNYNKIEEETQNHYVEFIECMREWALNKCTHYRKQNEKLQQEKDMAVKNKDAEIEQLTQQVQKLLKEKQQLMLNHREDVEMRDNEIEANKIAH